MAEEKKDQEQEDKEKLLAGKFKTPEELEKGYSESEKKMHEALREKKELEEKLQKIEEAQKKREEEAQETNEDTALESYEFLTKQDLLKAQQKQEEKILKLLEQIKEENRSYTEGTMILTEIKSKHPELDRKDIQDIVARYPDETDFESAYAKHREEIAKRYGLLTEPTEKDVEEIPIPSSLKGMIEVPEATDRSRIERIKSAGKSGSLKDHLQKK